MFYWMSQIIDADHDVFDRAIGRGRSRRRHRSLGSLQCVGPVLVLRPRRLLLCCGENKPPQHGNTADTRERRQTRLTKAGPKKTKKPLEDVPPSEKPAGRPSSSAPLPARDSTAGKQGIRVFVSLILHVRCNTLHRSINTHLNTCHHADTARVASKSKNSLRSAPSELIRFHIRIRFLPSN